MIHKYELNCHLKSKLKKIQKALKIKILIRRSWEPNFRISEDQVFSVFYVFMLKFATFLTDNESLVSYRSTRSARDRREKKRNIYKDLYKEAA